MNKMQMTNTTLCYIEKDGSYLMMHRVKKKNDLNKDKWVGIGGKFLEGETPFECAKREIKEETGLIAEKLNYRGIVTFVSDEFGSELMHLFTCTKFSGDIIYDCDEGTLEWVDKSKISSLPVWEGDKIFFELLEREERFFCLRLVYEGDKLISHKTDF